MATTTVTTNDSNNYNNLLEDTFKKYMSNMEITLSKLPLKDPAAVERLMRVKSYNQKFINYGENNNQNNYTVKG